MKLHTSPRAPNPRRVDMFIAEKGIEGIARALVDLNAGEHRSAAFTARNPLARVPVLELDDGSRFTEVAVLLQIIADRKPGALAPEVATIERYRLNEWLNFVATEIHKGYGTLWHPEVGEAAVAAALRPWLGAR